MSKLTFDVIVVGAGPAGLAAARKAAEEGLKTLVVERHRSIKAWKPCAEGVSKPTFKTAGIEPSEHIIDNVTKARVYAPNGNYVEIDEEGYNINKSSFLLAMAERAAEEGAEIMVSTTVKSVLMENGIVKGVVTNKGTIRGEVVVGADGFNSTVARSAGINRKGLELIPVYQYKFVNAKIKEPDIAKIFLGRKVAPLGYAWIFPKNKNMANVGIGVRKASPLTYLKKFIKEHREEFKNAKIVEADGSSVPIGGLVRELVRDNLVLIGDAAGTVIPFTGAGIHSSIAAGVIASKVIAEAISSGGASKDKLSAFIEKYGEYWGNRIRKSLKAMRIFENLSDDDLNLLSTILNKQDILDLANGFDLKRVALKLLPHPILSVKIAKSLLS